MAHDFVKFPELTNRQMQVYYFQSPHRQILESFTAECVRVIDGDTIMVRWYGRTFDFPVRFNNINAPELNEGGKEAKSWLKARIEGQTIDVLVDPKLRVGKFGRLLGTILHNGMSVGQEMIQTGQANLFGRDMEGAVPSLEKLIPSIQKQIPNGK